MTACPPGANPSTLPRVLVIEDDADSRRALRSLLQIQGYTVEEAGDGLVGLGKALGWRPDVLVVDVGLPGLDGYEVARAVRHALGDSVRLIALTAYGRPADRERGFAAGFDHYLVKPADPDELDFLLRLTPPRPAASPPCEAPPGYWGEDDTPDDPPGKV